MNIRTAFLVCVQLCFCAELIASEGGTNKALLSADPTSQTISFAALDLKTYGDPALELGATASSGLPVSYSSSNTDVATIENNVLTIVGAGTALITASQAGNAEYAPAEEVQQLLTVSKATLQATANNQFIYDDESVPALTISYAGFVGDDSAGDIDELPVATTTADDTSPVGEYPITLTGGLDNNYDIALNAGTLTVACHESTWYADEDGDGYGNPLYSVQSCTLPEAGEHGSYVANNLDCNDTDPTLSKTTVVYPDTDLDGFGDGALGITLDELFPGGQTCVVPDGYALNGLDCNDGNPSVTEVCIDAPTVPTSSFTFGSVGTTQLILGFQRGNGNGVLIVVSANVAPDFVPMENATYYPGQQVGNGRVVSSDDAIDVVVADLAPGTRHYFTAFEYNQSGDLIRYLVEGAPVASQMTLPLPNVYVTSPANGTTGRAIALAVTARALTGATTYEIELNDASDFSGTSFVLSGSRTQNFSGLSYATTYYARVRTDLSPDYGQVTTFSTLVPDIKVTSPADGSIDRAITLSLTATSLVSATIYTIEVSETSDFSSGVIVQSGARTQSFTGLKYDQLYFVRVKTDIYPVYGTVTTFRTARPLVYLTAPVDGAVGQNVSLNITALTFTGASTYTIELNTASDFSGTGIVQTGARTQSFSGLAYQTPYYARVRTNISPVYGKTTSFTTGSPSNFAFITSPANGAVNVGTSIVVTSNVVQGATTYTVQLSSSPTFAAIDFQSSGTFLTHAFAALAYGTTYYARVTTDLNSSPGEVRSFTTRTAESISYVNSPANGATAVNVNPTVSVRSTTVPGASLYTIQLSTDQNFTGIPLEGSSITTTVVFPLLAYNTTYYSRVRTNLTTEWGAVKSFTSGNPSLQSYLTSPVDGSVDAKWFGTVTLNTIPGALIYTVELNTASDFTGTSIVRVGTRTPTVTLAENQLYYVRVMTDMYPAWGPTRTFTTGNAVSLAYVVTPATGSTGVPTTVSVYANALPGATSYTIELNTNASFTGVSHVQTSAIRPIIFIGLQAGTTYYTRIHTSLAPLQWGPTKTFTTISSGGRTSNDWMGDEVDQLEVIEAESMKVVIFQNPISDKLTFLVESPAVEDAVITLTDLTGRNIHQSMEKTNSVIDIYPRAASGILLLQVRTSTNVKVTKVLKIE